MTARTVRLITNQDRRRTAIERLTVPTGRLTAVNCRATERTTVIHRPLRSTEHLTVVRLQSAATGHLTVITVLMMAIILAVTVLSMAIIPAATGRLMDLETGKCRRIETALEILVSTCRGNPVMMVC